jgi:omega-amidase
MNAHLVQLDIAWEDPAANRARVIDLVDAVAPTAGDLIVLPETAFTGFSLDTARTLPDSEVAEAFLADLAKRHRCTVVGGLVAADAHGRPSNQSLAFSPEGRLLARYTKLQPFSFGGEGAAHAAGEGIVLFECAGLTVAPFICYDLRFPEHFRAAVKLGAEVFVVIASWPVKRIHHWLTLLQARAIENQALVIGVNRCGTDPSFSYSGRSVVVSPHGHIIADAGESERVVTARIDATEIRRWRREFPALADIR